MSGGLAEVKWQARSILDDVVLLCVKLPTYKSECHPPQPLPTANPPESSGQVHTISSF